MAMENHFVGSFLERHFFFVEDKVGSYQGSPYCGISLGTGGTYRSDRRSVWAIHWYTFIYHVSVSLIQFGTARYVSYRHLINIPV